VTAHILNSLHVCTEHLHLALQVSFAADGVAVSVNAADPISTRHPHRDAERTKSWGHTVKRLEDHVYENRRRPDSG